jgi:translation initiation factor IF-2
MRNDLGESPTEVGPSVAVQLFGLGGVPAAGTLFKVYSDEAEGRKAAQENANKERDDRLSSQIGQSVATLSSLATFDDESETLQRMNMVLRADASGAVEAIRAALGQLPQDKVQLRYILAAPGDMTESDIDLAVASEALVVGFNVQPSEAVAAKAKSLGVEIWTYNIIYGLIDDVRGRMEGRLKEIQERIPKGKAKVLAVFGGGSAGRVAGTEVTEGVLQKGALVEVVRGKGKERRVVATDIKINSLRRFKDLVGEIEVGQECGMGVEGFKDWKEGDLVECYTLETKNLSLEEASTLEQNKISDRREALNIADD